jgi:hypothetical protein
MAKTLLSFLNMDEELGPALYFLGVRNDTQFETVKRMEPEWQIELLEKSKELQLNPLQTRVMYMIFSKF